MIPKATLLSLLSKAIADKSLTKVEIEALFPLPPAKPKRKWRRRVDTAILKRCREASEELGLVNDGLHVRAHMRARGPGHHLYLYRGQRLEMRGLSVDLVGLADLDAAIEKLVNSYMQRLDGGA